MMAVSCSGCTISSGCLLFERSKFCKHELFGVSQGSNLEFLQCKYPLLTSSPRVLGHKVNVFPGISDCFWEKHSTPLLDTINSPQDLKNLSNKELRQLADEIRSEIIFLMSRACAPFKASLASVELAVALHFVLNAPVDKILWDFGEHSYAHKILTGRRSRFHTLRQKDGILGFTSRMESKYDTFCSGHGCNSISAGLGMAVARDIDGKKNQVVTVISKWTTMAGQVYEAMNDAGYLDCNMIVILNESCHSPLPISEEAGSQTNLNPISSTLTKIQSSKSFRRLREAAKGVTKWMGKEVHEIAAKVDEYARGLVGPAGATLFEELGMYYIGPIDGHNIDDMISVLSELASMDLTGPVLVHVVTEVGRGWKVDSKGEEKNDKNEGRATSSKDYTFGDTSPSKTYNDYFAEALVAEAELDPHIVVVTAGMGVDLSLGIFQQKFPERFFDLGMAEQHAVTFAAGMCCGDLKPFCVIPSTFLQRAYDQVIEDVDLQSLPVRFAITNAGLVGPNGPALCGAFDIAFTSCLPNMIVMAPSDEDELVNMVATAVSINDRPVCFRFPRGIVFAKELPLLGTPLEIGKGEILTKGKDVALLAYGVMVQSCIIAHSVLSRLGVNVTIANMRFCKPLDIELIRMLCREHSYIITVEEGTIGGFGTHVSQFMALDGLLDEGTVKWRPILLPDKYIQHASVKEQFDMAGISGHHIAATTLCLLGRNREALSLMR
ncbi:hypothetical protein LUZ61_012792 [Rhynchospora tenuis]|uniref:1-deoxy-D-xylulose-5-phosphate synthase n=1 Tax=Rhynchospora tenuis TaxID=198213 RepID=A0AAD6A3M6_9POAL|nr:hypothetical protein LUZ61_012792 [Rhynchospora tenuis]